MPRRRSEPRRLRRGKAFHRKVQTDWLHTAEGQIQVEKTIRAPGRRAGRMDVFAASQDSEVRAILEVKASDWDRMTVAAVRRNVNRQAAQVWRYIEMHSSISGICPGIAFPKRPRSGARMRLVESLFEEHGIPVVWYDESLNECRQRHASAAAAEKKRAQGTGRS